MKLINQLLIIVAFMVPLSLGAAIDFDVTASCNNLHNGAIDLTASGSAGPFAFEWSNGATTEDISNLAAGTYKVTITFLGSTGPDFCAYEFDVEVPGSPPIDIEFDWQEPCPGVSFGELFISHVGGGVGPFTYLWNTGETSSSLGDVLAGNYCVTVTDANGCTASDCFDLENEPGCSEDNCPGGMIYGILVDDYPCFGRSNGEMTVYMDQGYTAVSYLWSNGATTQTISDIPAGNYCVTVTASNACTEVSCYNLTERTKTGILVNLGATPASGPNATDGAVNSSVSGGGIPPYSYYWTGPGGFTSTSMNISGLAPGEYCLRVRSRGCYETTECITVEYDCPYILLGIRHYGFIQCEGGTGTFTAETTGLGTPPYTFQWSNGENTATITDLQPGFYSVTVTDAVGCSDSFGVTMYVRNEPIVISGEVEDEKCDENNGSITLDIEGGEGTLTYLWSDGSTQKDRANLSSGTYCVTVTDKDGCEKDECFTVGEGTMILNVQIVNKENISFCEDGDGGLCDGSITISVAGSSGPFTYSWSGPDGYTSSSQNPTGLCPGNYTVTVTTPSGCQGTRTVYLCCCELWNEDPQNQMFEDCYFDENSTQINVTGTVTQVSSSGADDGAINVSVTGGTWTFYYSWTGPGGFSATTQDISDLAPGEYCVTVRDGCKKKTECFEVVDCSVENITVSGSVTNTCQGYSAGSINTSVSGGSAPYTYQWSNGSTSADPGNLSTGQYCVTVTDKNGCQSAQRCFTIGTNEITREDCSFYCNGNFLYSLEADYVFDQFDCNIIHWYCEDGFYLGWEDVGVADVVVNPFACQADVICHNGQILTTEYGQNCRDCIIFLDGSSVVACNIDYCYFPGWDASYVTFVDEENSVSSIQVQEGLCHVVVYDDCAGGQEVYNEFHNCNDVPFQDGDCWQYGIAAGGFFEGSFGNCSGFGGNEPTDKSRYEIRNYHDLKDIQGDRAKLYTTAKKYSDTQLNILYAENCKDFAVAFTAEEEGTAVLSFYDLKMNKLMSVETKVIAGRNKMYLENIDFSGKVKTEYILAKVVLPNKTEMWDQVYLDCSPEKKAAQVRSNEPTQAGIKVYPNPFTDAIDIAGLDENNTYQVEIFNSLGQLMHAQALNGSNALNLQTQSFDAGIYYLKITNTDSNESWVEKVVKLSE